MVIIDHMDIKGAKAMIASLNLLDIQGSEELSFTIDVFFQKSHPQMMMFDKGVPIGCIEFSIKTDLTELVHVKGEVLKSPGS